MIPAGFAQVTFLWSGTGLPFGAACTLGVEATTLPTPAAIGDAVRTAAATALIQTHVSADITNHQIHVKMGPDDTGPAAVVTGVGAGLDVDAQASPNTAYVIKKNAVFGGRKNRGRLFWPGIPQAKLNVNGTILGATLENQQIRWEDFFDKLVADGLAPVILHGDATAPTEITSLTCDPRAGTQRRRLRR